MLPEHRITAVLQELNAWHPSLAFELASCGRQAIPYLDVSLTLQDTAVRYKLYRKPNNANLLLHASSAHPQHTMQGMVSGEVQRIVRLSQTPQDRDAEINYYLNML